MSKLSRALSFIAVVGTCFFTTISVRADDPLVSDTVMLNIGGGGGITYTFYESSSFGSSGFGSEYFPAFAPALGFADGAVLLYDDQDQQIVSDQLWVENQNWYFASDSSLQNLQDHNVPVLGGLLETPGQPQDVSAFFGQPGGSVVVMSSDVVPEPTSIALAGLGLACLLPLARRRK